MLSYSVRKNDAQHIKNRQHDWAMNNKTKGRR
jgi:hypothetical protein